MAEKIRLASGMTAFLAKPPTQGKRPAVIVLHERYGLVQHTVDLAERLAAAGYVGCAPDLFHRFTGDREALARAEARCELIDNESIADLEEICVHLKSLPYVDGGSLACIGVCQTGRQPLIYAAERRDLAAAVVFNGGVYPREWKADTLRPLTIESYLPRISCPVLGLFGELDFLIPLENVTMFRDHLEKARRSYYIKVFANTPHGWINDSMGDGRYREAAAKEAWRIMLTFLAECFSGKWNKGRALWRYESDMAADYDSAKIFRPG